MTTSSQVLDRPVRMGVFYDGVTFKLISDYYRLSHPRRQRLDFLGLKSFVESFLARAHGECFVTEAHLFIGVEPLSAARMGRQPLAASFEHVLARCGVVPHCLPRNRFREKGVDMELGLEMLTAGVERRIDVAILLATDGDFEPLVHRMKGLGVPVVLLGFHHPLAIPKAICVSRRLADSVSLNLPMHAIIDRPSLRDREIVDRLFLQPSPATLALRRCA